MEETTSFQDAIRFYTCQLFRRPQSLQHEESQFVANGLTSCGMCLCVSRVKSRVWSRFQAGRGLGLWCPFFTCPVNVIVDFQV